MQSELGDRKVAGMPGESPANKIRTQNLLFSSAEVPLKWKSGIQRLCHAAASDWKVGLATPECKFHLRHGKQHAQPLIWRCNAN